MAREPSEALGCTACVVSVAPRAAKEIRRACDGWNMSLSTASAFMSALSRRLMSLLVDVDKDARDVHELREDSRFISLGTR